MTTFLSILFVLLAINALFLFFSVENPKDSPKKPFHGISKTSNINLFQGQYSDTEYKEAV